MSQPVHTDTLDGPRSRKGARTRARLVAAGREVFAEHGLLDARIADIAKRAGVSYGSFYNYFDSKEALFREIADDLDARLHEPMQNTVFVRGSTTPPSERLRRSIRGYLEIYRDEAQLLRAVEQAARFDGHVRATRSRWRMENEHKVASSIARLQARGLADPALDPTVASAVIGAMVFRFAEIWLADDGLECDFDSGVESVVRLVVNALGLQDQRD